MTQYEALVAVGMTVYVHNFAWVDEYLACKYATSDDIPLFNVSYLSCLSYTGSIQATGFRL